MLGETLSRAAVCCIEWVLILFQSIHFLALWNHFLHRQWNDSFTNSLITTKLNFSASHWQQNAFTFLPIKSGNSGYFYYEAKMMYCMSIFVWSGIALRRSVKLSPLRKLHFALTCVQCEELNILRLISVKHS